MVGRAAATGLPRGDERARDAPAAADERAGGVVDGADAVELSLEQPGKGHYRAQPATVDSSKDEGLFVTAPPPRRRPGTVVASIESPGLAGMFGSRGLG